MIAIIKCVLGVDGGGVSSSVVVLVVGLVVFVVVVVGYWWCGIRGGSSGDGLCEGGSCRGKLA